MQIPAREVVPQGGVFSYQEVGGGGGLDLASSLEAKFGARYIQIHQIRGKTWEVLLPQDAKVGKVSHLKVRGQNLGYLSSIFLVSKFGASTRISEANFAAKPQPNLLIWKYPPWEWFP